MSRNDRLAQGLTLSRVSVLPSKEFLAEGCVLDHQNDCWLAPSRQTLAALVRRGATLKSTNGNKPSGLLDNIAAATPGLEASPALAPAQTSPAAGVVRAQAQLKIATDKGFSVPEQYYALGTAVNETGANNARIKRQEHEAKPRVGEAMESLIAKISRERRRDATVPVQAIDVDPTTGYLTSRGMADDVLIPGHRAWGQLINLCKGAPPHASAYTSGLTPEWRAEEWRRIRAASNGRDVTLRLRYPDGRAEHPEIYSVVTDRYTPFGARETAETVLSMVNRGELNPDLRAEVEYRGGSATMHLSGFSNVQPKDYVCGEIFQAGLGLHASDDKSAGNSGWAEFIRNLCLNLLCLGEGFAAHFSVRHIGSAAELRATLVNGIQTARDAVAPFLAMWGMARQQPIDAIDLIETVKRLTAAEEGAKKADAVLAIPGVDGALLCNWIIEAYRTEPEETKAGLVNAISRAPQIGSFPDAFAAQAILAEGAARVLAMVDLPR